MLYSFPDQQAFKMFTFFEITIKIVTFDESVNMPSPILSLKKAEKDLKSNCLKIKPFVY